MQHLCQAAAKIGREKRGVIKKLAINLFSFNIEQIQLVIQRIGGALVVIENGILFANWHKTTNVMGESQLGMGCSITCQAAPYGRKGV